MQDRISVKDTYILIIKGFKELRFENDLRSGGFRL